jgi:hypothetical protein
MGKLALSNGGPIMAVGQKLVPLVNIKIAGKWMFIPLKMVLIGIDPYPSSVCFPMVNHGLHGPRRPSRGHYERRHDLVTKFRQNVTKRGP